MTLEEISLVQSTWAKVVPIKETAAELFYGKLFELDPALKREVKKFCHRPGDHDW
jgi:hypothetical protein